LGQDEPTYVEERGGKGAAIITGRASCLQLKSTGHQDKNRDERSRRVVGRENPAFVQSSFVALRGKREYLAGAYKPASFPLTDADWGCGQHIDSAATPASLKSRLKVRIASFGEERKKLSI